MKYFLDMGTHKFEGLLEYTAKIPMDKEWHVRCYEPNKYIYEAAQPKLQDLEKRYSSISFENAAVMDYTGMIMINCHKGAWKDSSKQEYIDGYTTGSNTLGINPKIDYGNGVVFNIENEICNCIDINEIIANIVEKDRDAKIFIKCDIEGSEFIVLPKLLQSKYLSNVQKMWVDWHERFWFDPDPSKNKFDEKVSEKQNLIRVFAEKGISLQEDFLEFTNQ